MKNIFKFSTAVLAATVLFASCQQEFKYEFAQNGPDVDVVSYSESAYMGGTVAFSVNISDPEFDLSTVKARLYFDVDMVGETVIRTKTPGNYEGEVEVPFLPDIPNGQATLEIVGQNVGQAITALSMPVNVTRPEFEYLTLKTGGQEYKMEPTSEKYVYAVEGSFPGQCNAIIESPAVPGTEKTLTFGWAGGEVALGGESEIPFESTDPTYTITLNILTYEASPFLTMSVNGTTAKMTSTGVYEAVVNLTQGGDVKVEGYAPGFADWTIDPDFIESAGVDATYKFLPVDGLYKVALDFNNKFFKFEAMKSTTELGTLNSDGTGALWLIGGDCYGKPTMAQGASWSPEAGGLCLAQITPKVHQITFVAGLQIATDAIDIKFFHQKTWGGEFGGGTITTDSDLVTVGESDGNVHLAEGVKLEMGGVYRFTVDLTNVTSTGSSLSGAVLHVEKVGEQEIPTEDIAVNGTVLDMVSAGHYSAVLDLTQNAALNVTGISMADLATYYLDPDYISVSASGASFAATAGKYKVDLYTEGKYVTFRKLAADGSDATLADGAIWIRGWGLAHPTMTSQFGWDAGFCIAEVRPMVFQFTGIAVPENDTRVGGRFRTDYIGAKYFYASAYGHGEAKAAQVEISGNAAALLKVASGGDINLADGAALEEGATYRLTVDLSEGSYADPDFTGKEKWIFEKL